MTRITEYFSFHIYSFTVADTFIQSEKTNKTFRHSVLFEHLFKYIDASLLFLSTYTINKAQPNKHTETTAFKTYFQHQPSHLFHDGLTGLVTTLFKVTYKLKTPVQTQENHTEVNEFSLMSWSPVCSWTMNSRRELRHAPLHVSTDRCSRVQFMDD